MAAEKVAGQKSFTQDTIILKVNMLYNFGITLFINAT